MLEKQTKKTLIMHDKHFANFLTFISHLHPPTFKFFHVTLSLIKSI